MHDTALPQLTAPLTLTDGGIETTLIFDDGFDLPHFASFFLLDSDDGRTAIDRYADSYVSIAREFRVPIVIETPTWRASADWGELLGYDAERLADVNRRAVAAIAARAGHADVIVSGCIGPRGEGYVADTTMTAAEAADYHRPQIEALRDGGAHLVSALTMTNVAEAVGIARAAEAARIESVITFTVETDGRLPSGESLADAIEAVDLATGSAPAYFMVNCATPHTSTRR